MTPPDPAAALPELRLDLRGRSFGATPVLGAMALRITRGDRLALLGPSGIGKTTLLRILLGLDRDFDGRLTGAASRAPVFQEPHLLPWRTAAQNLAITTGLDPETICRWLARVGLEGKGAHYPRQLSLGQQRRLSLARAFAIRPDILMMDEPFASLDADTAGRMIALTDAMLAETGAGLIIVTHDPAEATALAAAPMHLEGRPAVLRTTPEGKTDPGSA